MEKVSVALPGPWWTLLSYLHDTRLLPGVRVLVPVGKGLRVGIVCQDSADLHDLGGMELKRVNKVLDDAPVLPSDLWKTIEWMSDIWFTGLGSAAKALLPSKFFKKDEVLPVYTQKTLSDKQDDVKYIYERNDDKRLSLYSDIACGDSFGTLFLFPDVSCAKKFWEYLPKSVKDGAVLWPSASPSKQWGIWKEALLGSIKFIVGSQGASFIPMNSLSRIVIDEESSAAWITQKRPIFHHRPLLAARSDFAGAELILGGRVPSSKAFLKCPPEGNLPQKHTERLVFVDMKDAASIFSDALSDALPLSVPLVRETVSAKNRSTWSLWILDRKGYAGKIECSECTVSVKCPKCNESMRWEDKKNILVCSKCSNTMPVPDSCPSCGSMFLHGLRPGIEAAAARAKSLLGKNFTNILVFQDNNAPQPKELISAYPNGALIIGTRRALAFTEYLNVGLVGWLDADAEARGAEYYSKVTAFYMIWESLWRGQDAENRKIVIQSKNPTRGWQLGISRGWNTFWKMELENRRKFMFPPYFPMINIKMPPGKKNRLVQILDKEMIEYWDDEVSDGEIWIRTRKFEQLRKWLLEFFHIKNSRYGFPVITVYLD